jgi:hypothetical protein
VTGLRSWLGRSIEAARLASDRADLSIPGALASLAYLGWVPLLAAVAGIPRVADLAFLGARLYSSSVYPWNVLLLAAAASALVLTACLVVALAEAALLRALTGSHAARSLSHDTGVVVTVILLAALPAAAALAGLAALTAVAAPGVFTAPDLGAPLALRLLAALAPMLLALVVAVLLGQAFAAAAMRRAVGPNAEPFGAALRGAVRDVVRQPARRIGLALTATVAELVLLGLGYLLLRVLWAPIAADLAAGLLVTPTALILLVGFVAIWLALVLVGGVVHAWTSAWWSLELGTSIGEARPVTGGSDAVHP